MTPTRRLMRTLIRQRDQLERLLQRGGLDEMIAESVRAMVSGKDDLSGVLASAQWEADAATVARDEANWKRKQTRERRAAQTPAEV